jgi:hypothetical protein
MRIHLQTRLMGEAFEIRFSTVVPVGGGIYVRWRISVK